MWILVIISIICIIPISALVLAMLLTKESLEEIDKNNQPK